MAIFEFKGIDDLAVELKKLGDAANNYMPELLNAGADMLVEYHKKEAELTFTSGRSTGDLANSIGKGEIKGHSIDVMPLGNNRHGDRNATVAFVQEFGRSNMAATHWISKANAKAENDVADAMIKKWSDLTDE